MMRTAITITLILVSTMFISCAAKYQRLDLSSNTPLVWPSAPASKRVVYVGALSHPSQLGINKGLLSMIGEMFTGETEQKMIRPMAVTMTREQILYIADPGARGVHRYNIKKGLYDILRLEDNQPMPSPVAMATDAQGNAYVVDSENATVYLLDNKASAAKVFLSAEQFVQPTGIAIDSRNNLVYVTDTGAHQIRVFSIQGKSLFTFGKRGQAQGEFNYPTMIWLDSAARLYVTDSLNFRIQVFDGQGKFISFFGKQGDGTGHFSRPKGVATDSYGHVYVVDGLFHLFQLFDKQGQFLLHVGQQGQRDGEFWLPTGIFISQDNMIYVADSHNQRVQIFRYVGGPT